MRMVVVVPLEFLMLLPGSDILGCFEIRKERIYYVGKVVYL
jgi:hypothetical protein